RGAELNTQKEPQRHGERRGRTGGLFLFGVLFAFLVLPLGSFGQERDTSLGDEMIAEYFRQETSKLTKDSLAEIKTRADWEKWKPIYRKQLQEMLGLDPFPERTPLKPVITVTLEADDFLV